jgi:lipoprotein-anchoring transpeptidase ErfK/SrfK
MIGLLLAGLLPYAATIPAAAGVVVEIDKSTQRMSVKVDGTELYVWRVSTGAAGGPPAGTYRPERLERTWYSHLFNMAPMPHSIFFHGPYAIHGTTVISRLGTRASHGCVRLHPDNAATLFALVRKEGPANTTIEINR